MFGCVALLVGCSDRAQVDEDQAVLESECGSVALSVSVCREVSSSSEARSEESTLDIYEIPSELIPVVEELPLTIECDGEVYAEYESVSAYNEANSDGETLSPPMLPEGEYTFILTSGGDETEESATNACFYGELTVDVVARDYDAEGAVTLSLINSIVRISTTEAFDTYFVGGAQLTLSTEGGATIEYNTLDKSDEVLYVASSTALYLEGVGVTQPSTEDVGSSSSVTFARSLIGETTSGQMSSVVVDSSVTGEASITITIDDEVNYIEYDMFDLNPDSNNN